MPSNELLTAVAHYYGKKLEEYGPVARGVDWNSAESQVLRFEQLLKICGKDKAFSINDYGCGYGALAGYLMEQGYDCDYKGFDIAPEMITRARTLFSTRALFYEDAASFPKADYTVASGIFNVKMDFDADTWKAYMLETVEKIFGLSSKGCAFNALTKYSDLDHMWPDLYYADPLCLFDHCKRKLSRFVTLLHDYPLYEFTLLVRREDQHG